MLLPLNTLFNVELGSWSAFKSLNKKLSRHTTTRPRMDPADIRRWFLRQEAAISHEQSIMITHQKVAALARSVDWRVEKLSRRMGFAGAGCGDGATTSAA